MVNQATIDQLRDEMRTHAHLSKVHITYPPIINHESGHGIY